MAKNKKPRKAYHPKAVRTLCVAREDISGLQDMINRTALAAEISLPRGVATAEQLSCMKTLINHALTGIVSRNYLNEAERINAQAVLDKGGQALMDVVKKGYDRRTDASKEPTFICTSAELNAIRDAVGASRDFITDSLEVEPNRTLREFFAMQTLLRRGKAKGIDDRMVRGVLGELSVVSTCAWRNYK